MRILALETSCDETGASVLEKNNGKIQVLSNVIATSSDLHAKTGGIIPEMASREQVKAIIPVIIEALLLAEDKQTNNILESFGPANFILKEKIDAIAVTYGPGLIGSLIVGVETAKTLSFSFNKPIIPVNHLLAHIYANFINSPKNSALPKITYPFIGLIVSGGHTDLLCFESKDKYNWLGGTRDDAAGEAIDKIGRILNLPYPAGPEMERRANRFIASDKKNIIKFQSPLLNSDDFDFSFSGLKAESSRFIQKQHLTDWLIDEICAAVQDAIFNVLVKKTVRSLNMYNCDKLLIGGGVSANQYLQKKLENEFIKQNLNIHAYVPELQYATDNAAMIGAYALENFVPNSWQNITAFPDLYFD